MNRRYIPYILLCLFFIFALTCFIIVLNIKSNEAYAQKIVEKYDGNFTTEPLLFGFNISGLNYHGIFNRTVGISVSNTRMRRTEWDSFSQLSELRIFDAQQSNIPDESLLLIADSCRKLEVLSFANSDISNDTYKKIEKNYSHILSSASR